MGLCELSNIDIRAHSLRGLSHSLLPALSIIVSFIETRLKVPLNPGPFLLTFASRAGFFQCCTGRVLKHAAFDR